MTSLPPNTPITAPPVISSYPFSVKIFPVLKDGDTVFASHVNVADAEITAIETLIGDNPFSGLPYTTIGGAILDLFQNKAPLSHLHTHASLSGDTTGDDHPQYVRTDGTRGFTGPVTAPPATTSAQLATLGQVAGSGYLTTTQANILIAAALARVVQGGVSPPFPMPGFSLSSSVAWNLTGGYVSGCTDGSGNLLCQFSSAHPYTTVLQSFVATKMPVGGGHSCPPYNFSAAEITVSAVSLSQALVNFAQANVWAAYSWLAIGI